MEIQPIVVPAYENIGWDEQGEVIPGISMTVVRRIPTRNLTWLKSIVENYGKEFFEKFAIFFVDGQYLIEYDYKYSLGTIRESPTTRQN